MKILKNRIIMFLIILCYIPPGYLQQIYIYNNLQKILAILFCILIFVMYIHNHKLSIFILFLGLFEIIILVSTILNKGLIIHQLLLLIYSLSFCMYAELLIVSGNVKRFLEMLIYTLGCFSITNLVTLFVFPSGMYNNGRDAQSVYWFMGHDNQVTIVLLFLLCITILYSYLIYSKMKIWTFLICISSAVFTIIRWSATGILALGVLIIYIGFIWRHSIDKLKLKQYVTLGIVISILVVFFNFQRMFGFIIVYVLDRNLDFNRAYVWATTVQRIHESMLLGYGNGGPLKFIDIIGLPWAASAHNLYLEITYQGGILALVLFLILLYVSAKAFDKNHNKIFNIISITIFLMLITFIVEVYGYIQLFFLLLLIAFYIEDIEKNFMCGEMKHRIKFVSRFPHYK